jgi:starvation-inducible outer membrane lipoprotein
MKLHNVTSNAVKTGVAIALAVALTACNKAPESAAEQQQPAAVTNTTANAQAMPANHPAMPGQQGATATTGGAQIEGGVIKEVMTGGGYTYVKVERAGNQFWAAGPMVDLKVGQLIGWQGGAMMTNFHSSSLDRDFAQIVFVGAFVNPTEGALSAGASAKTSLPGGVVEEVMNGGGYTYVRVTQNGKTMWAAGPMAAVKVGDSIAWQGGSLMNNFASKSLNKTFDQIYFVSGFVKPGAAQAAAAGTVGEVKQVIGSAGYSYIEVLSNGKELWLAAPENSLAQGDKISWQGGSVMRNFESRSLNRIFEEIVFVDGVIKVN